MRECKARSNSISEELKGPDKGEYRNMERIAQITRNTNETQIKMTLNLDGSGKANIHTGIGFFDHMLNSFARHGFLIWIFR